MLRNRGERGASAVEYGLIVAACVLGLLASLFLFRHTLAQVYISSACDHRDAEIHCCPPPPDYPPDPVCDE